MRTTPQHPIRMVTGLTVGTVLFIAAFIASQVIPTGLLGLELQGSTWLMVGAIQLVLGLSAVKVGLIIGRKGWADIGASIRGWPREALIGAGVAAIFALLQFALIIPMTGGATRSDVVVNSAMIGKELPSLFSILAFQLVGPAVEEIYFRGLLLGFLLMLLPGKGAGATIAVAITTILFALGHGYQGVSGMVDTGLYGGLTLSLLYLWRRSLIAPIIAHVGWNVLAAIGIFVLY